MTLLVYIVGKHGVGKTTVGSGLAAYYKSHDNTVHHMVETVVEAPTAQDVQAICELGICQPYTKKLTPFDVVIAEYVELPEDAYMRPFDMIIRIERAA